MTKITNSRIPLIQPLRILQFLKNEVTKAKGVEKKNKAGEKTAGGGSDAGEKTAGGVDEAGGKLDDGLATILLKLDLHCEGCAKKAKRSMRQFEGVEDVKADYSSGKLTVKGNVDPLWLREMVENKTNRKVELLSAQPKKDGGGGDDDDGDKKSDDIVEKKAEEKKTKEPQFTTVVLKIRLQCHRNAQKAKRIIKKINGVEEVSVSLKKDLVTVKGTMDVKELTSSYLKDKLKRNIDVVSTPMKDGKSKVESRELKEQKTEAINKMEYNGYSNKMEYYGYSNPTTYYAMPMYNHNYMDQDYGLAMHNHQMVTGQDYDHTGYVPPPYVTAPQMFSDENPNGCSVM